MEEEGDNYLIKVANSGPQIPDKVRHRIFEPFFTTKEIEKGTGLGLSISKKIAEKNQGDLILEEGLDHTCFKITIPKSVSTERS